MKLIECEETKAIHFKAVTGGIGLNLVHWVCAYRLTGDIP